MAAGEKPEAQAETEGPEQIQGPEETLMHHRVELDAMGHDKRRAVVGKSYGPSIQKQLAVYGAFFAIVAVLSVGFFLLAKELDKPPDTISAEAKWAAPGAVQRPPNGIDQSPP